MPVINSNSEPEVQLGESIPNQEGDLFIEEADPEADPDPEEDDEDQEICEHCDCRINVIPCEIPWHVRPRLKENREPYWDTLEVDLCGNCVDLLDVYSESNELKLIGWNDWDAKDYLECLLNELYEQDVQQV